MKKQPEFYWDEETRTATCIIFGKNNKIFVGEAFCHDDDYDMMSERTGCEIAFRRAKIKQLRDERDNELKPALKALQQLYYSMNQSTHFNEKSYENQMLQRQIRLVKFDLTTLEEIIADECKYLRDYIQGKDKLYNKLRKKNNQVENN